MSLLDALTLEDFDADAFDAIVAKAEVLEKKSSKKVKSKKVVSKAKLYTDTAMFKPEKRSKKPQWEVTGIKLASFVCGCESCGKKMELFTKHKVVMRCKVTTATREAVYNRKIALFVKKAKDELEAAGLSLPVERDVTVISGICINCK